MSSDVLLEEFEVLESIYPEELTKISERLITIEVEPDDPVDGADPLKLTLTVDYPDTYPDDIPILSLEPSEGDLEADEVESLLDGMKAVGAENQGMAMTFTIVSHLREQSSFVVRSRLERRKMEEAEQERKALEEEEALTRGTPVTLESFLAWKREYDKGITAKKARLLDERLKGLLPKEKEEYKKIASRLTGRQLFERDRNLATSDDSLLEEGTISVDVSQYERTREHHDEDENDRVHFSDSD